MDYWTIAFGLRLEPADDLVVPRKPAPGNPRQTRHVLVIPGPPGPC